MWSRNNIAGVFAYTQKEEEDLVLTRKRRDNWNYTINSGGWTLLVRGSRSESSEEGSLFEKVPAAVMDAIMSLEKQTVDNSPATISSMNQVDQENDSTKSKASDEPKSPKSESGDVSHPSAEVEEAPSCEEHKSKSLAETASTTGARSWFEALSDEENP